MKYECKNIKVSKSKTFEYIYEPIETLTPSEELTTKL